MCFDGNGQYSSSSKPWFPSSRCRIEFWTSGCVYFSNSLHAVIASWLNTYPRKRETERLCHAVKCKAHRAAQWTGHNDINHLLLLSQSKKFKIIKIQNIIGY